MSSLELFLCSLRVPHFLGSFIVPPCPPQSYFHVPKSSPYSFLMFFQALLKAIYSLMFPFSLQVCSHPLVVSSCIMFSWSLSFFFWGRVEGDGGFWAVGACEIFWIMWINKLNTYVLFGLIMSFATWAKIKCNVFQYHNLWVLVVKICKGKLMTHVSLFS